MPGLNHKEPEGEGPKTGRKLGKCKKTDSELKQIAESGKNNEDRLHLRQNSFGKKIKLKTII